MYSRSAGGRRGVAVLLGGVFAATVAACADPGLDSAPERTGEGRAAALGTPPLRSLKGVAVPAAANLGDYIRNTQAAIVLGKAFFWDSLAGSDGQACATCHFHAGADDRKRNQLSPGLLNESIPAVSSVFNPTATGAGGPNYDLTAADFPFHRLSDPLDRNSTVLFDTDDTSSSQGVFHGTFVGTIPGAPGDVCTPLPDIFEVGTTLTRRVEPRNTPTMINAGFNYRNFWDGRANNHFNGVNPFGTRDTGAVVHAVQAGAIVPEQVDLANSSLASQAVGPAGSAFEMACEGRSFTDLAHKLLPARALRTQDVDPTDSVLAAARHPGGKGLTSTYAQLVQAAFPERYWKCTTPTCAGQPGAAQLGGVTLMEANFSLFWGLAIQAYESTLVSDDSRLDRFFDGNPLALTDQEKMGLDIFQGKGGCISCHNGPELTGAATALFTAAEQNGLVERMLMGDFTPAIYDNGFYNIGVRPAIEDRGVGRLDPFGNPLSFARQAKIVAGGGNAVDAFVADPASFVLNPATLVSASERDAVDGAFKVPSLRNVALTGPYFHNGGKGTLEQVVEFYNRGGDRRGPDGNDTTGFGVNPTNFDADIQPLGLTPDEKSALVAFLRALTDERVRWEKAPFDHPQIRVPDGHPKQASGAPTEDKPGRAKNRVREIPAVGRFGRAPLGLAPLGEFL
jgi:cytochrome c peroxidase